MSEDEILSMWKSGVNKWKLAELYKRRYNQNIRIIRASVRHRHDRQINKQQRSIIRNRKSDIQKYKKEVR